MNHPANEKGNVLPPGWRMAAVLGAAMLAGVAFNSMNPLGVRAAILREQNAPPASVAATDPKSPYGNDTISIGLAISGNSPVAVPVAPAAEPVVVPNAESLTWPETKKLLGAGKILLVDAREAVYYGVEHIPGAVSLPASSPNEALLAFANKYPHDAAVVVYCGSDQCPLANQVVSILKGQLGFSNVREMPGGFAEYRVAMSAAGTGGSQ